MPLTINLPHIYQARSYQLDFWDALHGTGIHTGKNYRIFVKVWHRRGGKDMTDWNAVIERTAENPGNARYIFPTNDMARANLWEAYTNDGLRFTDFVPMGLRVREHKTDDGLNDSLKRINFITGGSLRVVSGHKPNTLRGGNDHTFGLSEFQAMDPSIIDIISPIVRLNGGKIIINMTANGESAAKVLLEYWKKQSDVYVSEITIEDTGLLTPEEMDGVFEETIAMFRARGQSEEEAIAFVRQEYYCDWSAPVIGSYFGAAMKYAQEEGRITKVPYETNLPVYTFWDLGIDDSMSIWFAQFVGREIRLIDYYENSGEGFNHYARTLKGQTEGFEHMRHYMYAQEQKKSGHYAPHDIQVRNMGQEANTRMIEAAKAGIDFNKVKRISQKENGIEAVRALLSRCWFDETRCMRGISALKGYRKEYNEKLQVYYDKPVHDWTSHGTDAFQTLATSEMIEPVKPNQGGRVIRTGGASAPPLPTTTHNPDGSMQLNVDVRRAYAKYHKRTLRR